MLHLPWISFNLLLVCCTFHVEPYRTLEIVRRGPSDEGACDTRLMDTQTKLPDSAFSASSVRRNLTEFKPYHARLVGLYAGKDHTNEYAWCPNSTVQMEMNEWIQVDFSHLSIIRTIFTMGRGDGNVAEYMPYFVLHYQREDNGPWYEHTTRDSKTVIQANIDPRNTARHTFDPTVIARRIRIYPYNAKSHHPVCLRFALQGCPFPDGITGYSASEGSRGHLVADRYQHIDFRDLTNDANKALKRHGDLKGLGKLVDNVAHLGNLTWEVYDSFNPYFVGWERSRSSPVWLHFKFDELRNFTRLLIFTFKSTRLRVGFFNYTVIDFSKNGALSTTAEETRLTIPLSQEKVDFIEIRNTSWRDALSSGSSNLPIVFRNSSWDGAAVVSIPLRGHVAQEIHMKIYQSNDWLLISEVQFISELASAVPSRLEGEEEKKDPNLDAIFPDDFDVKAELGPYLFANATTTTVTTTTPSLVTVVAGLMNNVHHEDISDGGNIAAGSMVSVMVTHRQGVAKDQLRANSRGTTFIIVVVISLLLSVFCLVLIFSLCVRMQHSRKHRRSLKKYVPTISSQMASAPPPPPLNSQQDATAVSVLSSPYHPGAVGVSICNNLTSVGPCSAAPTAFLFSPSHSTGMAGMYGTGAPRMQVLSSPAMFSPLDSCPDGLPSPGHTFASLAGSDLATMQQMALQQQYYPPAGMIHPATGGDTTTDSGSLYTTPPALCSVLSGGGHVVLRRRDEHLSGPTASPSTSFDDETGDIEIEEKEDESDDFEGNENGRIRRKGMPLLSSFERRSVTASSASEGVQHTSISTIGGGGAGVGESSMGAGDVESFENSALIRPGYRKRPKHRRRRGDTASSHIQEGVQGICDYTLSRPDVGVGNARAPGTVAENAFTYTHTTLQPFVAQTFPSIPCNDVLGTEYASTSLFGSSNASSNGFSTLKKCSFPMIGTNGPVAPYPSLFLTAPTAHFPDPNGSQIYATAGGGGGGGSSAGGGGAASYHLYQSILVPAKQAHFFQNAVAAAAAGLTTSPQLGGGGGGGSVHSPPLSSQGLMHSAISPTTVYNSEAPLAISTSTTNGGCWPMQQTTITGLKSSAGTPLPPVPILPLSPSLHHNHRNHNHSTNESTSSGRLSIYSVCM